MYAFKLELKNTGRKTSHVKKAELLAEELGVSCDKVDSKVMVIYSDAEESVKSFVRLFKFHQYAGDPSLLIYEVEKVKNLFALGVFYPYIKVKGNVFIWFRGRFGSLEKFKKYLEFWYSKKPCAVDDLVRAI